jgi:hypothetical protein
MSSNLDLINELAENAAYIKAESIKLFDELAQARITIQQQQAELDTYKAWLAAYGDVITEAEDEVAGVYRFLTIEETYEYHKRLQSKNDNQCK